MKKITSISTAVLATIVLFSSCKKDNTVIPTPQPKKIVKVELTGSNNATTTFSYNAQGRLKEMINNVFTQQFDFASAPYLQYIFNTGSTNKSYETKSTAVANGKITSADRKSFKPDGSLNYSEPNNFQYDAAGFVINRSYGQYNYVNEYTGGNMTKSTGTSFGAPFSVSTFEYYTDKTDKFNINLIENYYLEQYLNDQELFGKKNKNLLKKVTYDYTTGNDFSYEFVYTLDADGYVTGCITTEKINGVASGVYNYKFTYQ